MSIEIAPENGQVNEALVEYIAKAMAFASVGDPDAKDRTGNPRWKWREHEARKFLAWFPPPDNSRA